MKRYYLISLVLSAAFVIGCSGNAAAPGTNSGANSTAQRSATATAEANSEAVIPGITGAPSNADPKGIQQQRLPEKSGGPDTQVAEATRDAPDDSTFTTRLTDIAVETRTFKSHPQLKKVVKTIAPGKTDVKVYLNSGKVIEVPAEKMANLATMPAMDILSLIGINPTPAAAVPGKQDGQKQ